MKKSTIATWLLTVALIFYNWSYWDSLSIRIFVTTFLILVAIFSSKPFCRSLIPNIYSNKEEFADYKQANTPALKRKYGKFYHIRIYWSLAFFVITSILSEIFTDITFLTQLTWFALVVFFIDGIYLCITKFSAERK